MTGRFVGLPPQPEGRGPNGRRLCRGRCGREVGRGRSAWCSDECQNDALIRAGFGTVIQDAVLNRDQGVCAICGADAGLAARIDRHLIVSRTSPPAERAEKQAARETFLQLWGASSWSPHLWEADHVVPVSEGGAGCGLEGYRTLCRPCHSRESGLLRRRLNARHRSRISVAAPGGWRTEGFT